MQIDLSRESDRVSVVAPRGRLDLASAPTLRERLRQLIASGTSRLVVDLGDVTFVDSSGLGAVIGGLKAARQAGGDLRIARPNQQVQLVLNLTSLNKVLRPYGTLEEALSGY
jgi:anti-anti-sigma factor